MREFYPRLLALGSVAALTAIVAFPGGAWAQSDPIKCRRAIVKNQIKYVKARVKTIGKCEEANLKGKAGASPCPAPADLGGGTPAEKARAKVDKAASKIRAGIAKACGGADKVCGNADDNLDVQTDLGYPALCPDFESSGYGGPLTDCGKLADCMEGIGRAAADEAVSLYYANMDPASGFGSGSALNKCQIAIGKETGKFLLAKHKNIAKCWDAWLNGKPIGSGQCPDKNGLAGLPAAKAAEKISKAESKLISKICKACGGAGKLCSAATPLINDVLLASFAGDGLGDDFPITGGAGIYTAFSCPADTTVPGEVEAFPPDPDTNCSAITVSDLSTLAQCLICTTEYKVDCIDRSQVGDSVIGPLGILPAPTPPECNALCGNGVLDANEDCDPAGGGATDCTFAGPNGAGNGLEACQANCACPCPGRIDFVADPNDPNSLLDPGWTGLSHDAQVSSDGLITVEVTGCAGGSRSPNCGVCDFRGPVTNTGAGSGALDSQRCSCDTSVRCTAASDCPGACDCNFFFGTLLPLSAGGVSTCVSNEVTGSIVGTANVDSGESASSLDLTSHVFLGPVVDAPCPKCEGDGALNDGVLGGTCDTGVRAGLACDANGSHPIPAFGQTSLDCPPLGGANIANLPINLTNSTDPETVTLTAEHPTCTATGFSLSKCFCDTCDDAAGTLCTSDQDCIDAGLGGKVCGGLRCLGGPKNGRRCKIEEPASAKCDGFPCGRLGTATAPFPCTGGSPFCTPFGGNEGVCTTGPFDGLCSPTETFRGCSVDSDCPFVGDFCLFGFRECFTDNGIIGGSISASGQEDTPAFDDARPTLASIFCIGPTSSTAVNDVAGLPGPGRLNLNGDARGLP